MGSAEKWQDWAATELFKKEADLIILNPRRDEWDASWEQTPENAQFREQVEWELQGQEEASVRGYYFSANSRAPITLLELGLFHTRPCVVYCPREFYRSGNVYIVTKRYQIPITSDPSEWLALLIDSLNRSKNAS